tara:strand:- start:122 stop:877 length:756 start_codon:yes stop_codon:yes gene_type:complete
MKRNVVFLTAITFPGQEYRSAPYKYGIQSWAKWCDKNNCELFVLDEPIFPTEYCKPNFYRYWAFDLLDANDIEYDQICLTDADCIIHPDCPNFFELTDHKYAVTATEGSMDWVCRSLENYGKFVFEKEFPLHRYFNAGFQVINKSHRDLINKFQQFYQDNRDLILHMQSTYAVGTDQPLINYIVNLSDTDVKYMHYQYCMADLARKEILDDEMTFTKILKGIYQFNAIPDNHNAEKTMYWMKRTYEELYEN